MAGIGYDLNNDWGLNSTDAYSKDVPVVLMCYGYNSSGLVSYNKESIITEVDNNRPIYFRGTDNTQNSGHAWVVVGYEYNFYRSYDPVWNHINNEYDWVYIGDSNIKIGRAHV